MSLHRVIETLDAWMRPETFQDYAPNGLQVEGRADVRRLALGVTASLAVIEAAVAWGADALLVHHGYFWRNEPAVLTGMKGARVRALIQADLSLIAYHLPLDCHLEFGNNVTLLHRLGCQDAEPLPDSNGLLWSARLDRLQRPVDFAGYVGEVLGRVPLLIESPRAPESIERIVVCTGGAQDYLLKAHQAGADLYLSGEISERTTHEARELGTHYLAAGHHATERFGVQALGARLAHALSLEVKFFDDGNPA